MNHLLIASAALAAAALAACATPPPRLAPPPPGVPAPIASLAQSIAAAAERSEHESDGHVRGDLADLAQHDADACIQQAPEAVACLFGRAVALGLQAKAHPTRAASLLTDMLAALAQAEAVDANYNDAGPARVQALVLIRAPGWPLGPGDPERGLTAARRAVDLRSAYPPNLLALAEAQSKMEAPSDARASYTRAREAALTLPAGADQDAWVHEAEVGLSRLK